METEVKSITLSEPVKIGANFNEWQTEDFSPGERVYTKQVAFLGVRFNHGTFGVTSRYHYYLNFTPDVSLLYYLEKNGRLDEQKTTLDINLRALHTLGSGVYYSHRFEFDRLTFNMRMSYLKLRQLTQGTIMGQYDPAKDVTHNQTRFVTDYAYTTDHILDREVDAGTGRGLVFDLWANWSWHSHQINASFDELYSKLHWQKAPASYIEGDMEAIGSSEGSAVEFDEFFAEVNQRLPVHSVVSYNYNLFKNNFVGYELEDIDTKVFHKLVAKWEYKPGHSVKLSKANMNDLWGVSWITPWSSLHFEADNIAFDKAHTFKLTLNLRYFF